MKAERIKLLVLDVDGVLTDGRIQASSDGEPTKTFHVQDGCAIKLWRHSGGKVAILSGRTSDALAKRAAELGIDWVRTGVKNKLSAYAAILTAAGYKDPAVAYLGDDLPDLGPLLRCGFPVAVSNAVSEVKRAATYVTRRAGGEGAVAEVVELLLRKQGRWSRELIAQV